MILFPSHPPVYRPYVCEVGQEQQGGGLRQEEMEDVFELKVVDSLGTRKVPKDDTSFPFNSENGKG